MEQLRSSVTFYCDVKTTADQPIQSNITWFRNQHEVKNDAQFTVNNGRLHFRTTATNSQDNKSMGTVRCGAHSPRAGMVFSKAFDLDALLDRIENRVQKRRRPSNGRHQKRSNDSPRRMIAYTEDQITLYCRLAGGLQGGLVEWTRDGKSFRTSRDEGPGDGKRIMRFLLYSTLTEFPFQVALLWTPRVATCTFYTVQLVTMEFISVNQRSLRPAK